MNALTRGTATMLSLLLIAAATSEAFAQPPSAPPPIGFQYRAIPGFGYRIVGVFPGSPAERMGLEIGDLVLAINGHPLSYHGAHVAALMQSATRGGVVTLRVQDIRTGAVTVRSGNLLSAAPVAPFPSAPPVPFPPLVAAPW